MENNIITDAIFMILVIGFAFSVALAAHSFIHFISQEINNLKRK